MDQQTVHETLNAVVRDLGEGIIEAVASESEDRHGAILLMDGLDISRYKQNPVVAWAHKHNEAPVAQALSLRKTDGKLVAKMKFAIDEYPFAHQIYKLYKGGFLRAFSIGFVPKEIDDNCYAISEMIEYSAVVVPANPEALTLAAQKGIDVDLVRKMAGEQATLTPKQLHQLTAKLEHLEGLVTSLHSYIRKQTKQPSGRPPRATHRVQTLPATCG